MIPPVLNNTDNNKKKDIVPVKLNNKDLINNEPSGDYLEALELVFQFLTLNISYAKITQGFALLRSMLEISKITEIVFW